MQPIPDTFLPDSEQFLPNSLKVALSTATQSNLQLDVLFGANDLEALNYNGLYNFSETQGRLMVIIIRNVMLFQMTYMTN